MVFGERIRAVVVDPTANARETSRRAGARRQTVDLTDRPIELRCRLLELCDVCRPQPNRRRLKTTDPSREISWRNSRTP
jgi:hypothetical protein